jgi:hypothetical protein
MLLLKGSCEQASMLNPLFVIQYQSYSNFNNWVAADTEYYTSYQLAEARVNEFYERKEGLFRIVQIGQSTSTSTMESTKLLNRWELHTFNSKFGLGKMQVAELGKKHGVVDYTFVGHLIVHIDLPLDQTPTEEQLKEAIDKYNLLTQLHHIQERSRLKHEEKTLKESLLVWKRITIHTTGDWPYGLSNRPIKPFYLPKDTNEALDVKYRVRYQYKQYDNQYHSAKLYDHRLDGYTIHCPGVLISRLDNTLMILISPEVEHIYSLTDSTTKDLAKLWLAIKPLAMEILGSENSFLSK